MRGRDKRARQMMTITNKGYEAMKNGEPRIAPYKGYRALSMPRNYAWLDGWDCAFREELEARSKNESEPPTEPEVSPKPAKPVLQSICN